MSHIYLESILVVEPLIGCNQKGFSPTAPSDVDAADDFEDFKPDPSKDLMPSSIFNPPIYPCVMEV